MFCCITTTGTTMTRTYPNASSSFLHTLHVAGNRNLVALLLVVAAVAIGKVNVTAGLFHDLLDGQTALADDV